jgi:superoxide dismutase, Cu-Zn family
MKAGLLSFILLISFGCASREERETKLSEISPVKAVSILHSSSNEKLNGTVIFVERNKTLTISTDFSGLKSNALLGLHIHEKGICEGPDYETAGDHFNPQSTIHGGISGTLRHKGDLGNIQTDQMGNAKNVISLEGVTIDEISGKALILHAKKDDLKSQPAGNSGKRIACGLIMPIE